jgi:predicted cupin superfamily sugar epimerase
MSRDARYWIKTLNLAPHPEGGYFRQTYRSDLSLPASALPAEFSGPRPASTAIYFLIDGENFSALHRLRSDEMWHFYSGGALVVHELSPDGSYTEKLLGSDPGAGEQMQLVVPAGHWFAACVRDPATYSLVGCTVAPGFDFADFELARRDDLLRQYPQHRDLIVRFTRG